MAADPRLQHSSVLDQHHQPDQSTLTGGDLSQSETLPSISFDEETEQQQHPGFLKDLNERVLMLREENFDLKMKLYLLESQENLTGDSESKRKILDEFDRKNEEIRNLKMQNNSLRADISRLKGLLDKTKIKELKQKSNNGSSSNTSTDIRIDQQLLSLADQLDVINTKIMKHID